MSACRVTVFLALLHNHCYSLHKTKSRLVTSIWQGPGPVAIKMPFFRRNSSLLQIFSAPTQEGNLLFLSKRSARKKLYNFPIKLNHMCRTSRHVWISSSVCDHCFAYQLICIMTISTFTTDVRAHFFPVQEPTCHFRPCTRRVSANCKSFLFISLKEKSDITLFSVRWSQYFIDCSQSFIFPWDRQDTARLTVNGGHLCSVLITIVTIMYY